MQISVCKLSVPKLFTGPFIYKYYSEETPAVKAEFENEKVNPNVNSPEYITYEPS